MSTELTLAIAAIIVPIVATILTWWWSTVPDYSLGLRTSEIFPKGKEFIFPIAVHMQLIRGFLIRGVVRYPKFHYILTFKDSEDVKTDTKNIRHETTMLQDRESASWNIAAIQLTKDECEHIQYLYLVSECMNQIKINYFTIIEFEYNRGIWDTKRIISDIKMKWFRKKKIELFKKKPKEWIKKYGVSLNGGT